LCCRRQLSLGRGGLYRPAKALALCVARRCTVEGSRPDGARPIARMCSEANASVPGWVAAAWGLAHAMLTIQSVFDWFDLRSYDIREHQEQTSHLRPGAMTSIHSNGHTRRVRALGMGDAAIPWSACASAACLWGRDISHQSLRSAYCHEYSQDAGRFSSGTAHAGLTRRRATHHANGTIVPQVKAALARGDSEPPRRTGYPRMMGQLVPPPPAVLMTIPS
jgi:hypothetical protein